MEVTALCFRLIINTLMLLAVEDQHGHCAERNDAASLRIVPNTLQLFEYESLFFDCEGFDRFTEWRVMKRIMGTVTTCGLVWETSNGPCRINHAFSTDSGEYWCEAGGIRRSSSVNISVSTGSVILESPAVPVVEGDSVTLRCRNKMTSSVFITDFFKDGIQIETDFKENMTILNVSRSDEGLYRCSISGSGESAESRLTVRAQIFEDPPSLHEEIRHHSPVLILVVTGTAVALLSLVLGLFLLLVCVSSKKSTARSQSAETGVSSFTVTPVTDALSAGRETTDAEPFYYTID
ncbi:low affinity immunoglobulin gamma Fc region receptor II [Lates calcarifer]|uniref:low affinity immunoglobulin gamma Fc region receptor II n=1 Tax=Lates calcarifer TaxID=8187 RepID=UPI000874093B|nr:low affinity immunoglobulin gamma Fc region receptor II [Lates calcarifer]